MNESCMVFYICPIGALTSKPQAFSFRVWELNRIKGFDFFDSFLVGVDYELLGGRVVRVLPELVFDKEESLLNLGRWVPDRVRFSYDSFDYNICGLDRFAYIKIGNSDNNNEYLRLDFVLVCKFFILYSGLCFNVRFFLGDFLSFFDRLMFYDFSKFFGSCWVDFQGCFDFRDNYLLPYFCGLNEKFCSVSSVGVVNNCDDNFFFNFCNSDFSLLLLVGLNLRFDFPYFDYYVRRLIKKGKLMVLVVGELYDYLSNFVYMFSNVFDVLNMFFGKLEFVINFFKFSVMNIFVGKNIIWRLDGFYFYEFLKFCINSLKLIFRGNINYRFLSSSFSDVISMDFGLDANRLECDGIQVSFFSRFNNNDYAELSNRNMTCFLGDCFSNFNFFKKSNNNDFGMTVYVGYLGKFFDCLDNKDGDFFSLLNNEIDVVIPESLPLFKFGDYFGSLLGIYKRINFNLMNTNIVEVKGNGEIDGSLFSNLLFFFKQIVMSLFCKDFVNWLGKACFYYFFFKWIFLLLNKDSSFVFKNFCDNNVTLKYDYLLEDFDSTNDLYFLSNYQNICFESLICMDWFLHDNMFYFFKLYTVNILSINFGNYYLSNMFFRSSLNLSLMANRICNLYFNFY